MRRSLDRFPLRGPRLQLVVGDEQVPHNRLKHFRLRRDVVGVDRRHDRAGRCDLCGVVPSLPTMPITGVPTCCAYCSAVTRFGLTFFSRLQPPTESTKIKSWVSAG